MARDERVDAYIERQAEFAKPILTKLRAMVHAAEGEHDDVAGDERAHERYVGYCLCIPAPALKTEFKLVSDWIQPMTPALADP
mgnify:CR=1 FL=1